MVHPDGFDDTQWEILSAGYAPDWKSGVYYDADVLVSENGLLYKCVLAHTAAEALEADAEKWRLVGGKGKAIEAWTAGEAYDAGQCVFYRRQIYRANAAHTASPAFTADAAHWELIDAGYLPDWKSGEAYEKGMAIVESGMIYRANTAHIAKAAFAQDSEKWTALAGKGAKIGDWQPEAEYDADDMVFCRRILYRAVVKHLSGNKFTPGNWRLMDKGYLPNWETGQAYEPMMTVVQAGDILRCKVAHTAAVFADEKTSYWEVISTKQTKLTDWQAGATYAPTDAVARAQMIYVCREAHTASERFADDMQPGNEKWLPIRGYREEGILRQATKLGVSAPKTVTLAISKTATFNLPPVEVLKFRPYGPNQIVTACGFDNSEASDFIIDGKDAANCKYIAFDGVMKPVTDYAVDVGDLTPIAGGVTCESDWIDCGEYRDIISIRGGF